ncbi:MAG: SRPBCC family protein [Bacteroidales bacterium]
MSKESTILIKRFGAVWQLRAEIFIPKPVELLWPFFSDPANLEKITPPAMRFRILTPHNSPAYPGLMISYRVSPMPWYRTNWLTEITAVKDGKYFIDEQRKGPYAIWHHEHHFSPTPGGTICTDIVTYRIPGGALGSILHSLFIRKKLMGIFRYREVVLRSHFQ